MYVASSFRNGSLPGTNTTAYYVNASTMKISKGLIILALGADFINILHL
jgi:hypothetical protein